MQVLICEMIRADFNMRPSCRDLLDNKIITAHVSTKPGIQINILLSNILQQYIDIANININIEFLEAIF